MASRGEGNNHELGQVTSRQRRGSLESLVIWLVEITTWGRLRLRPFWGVDRKKGATYYTQIEEQTRLTARTYETLRYLMKTQGPCKSQNVLLRSKNSFFSHGETNSYLSAKASLILASRAMELAVKLFLPTCSAGLVRLESSPTREGKGECYDSAGRPSNFSLHCGEVALMP